MILYCWTYIVICSRSGSMWETTNLMVAYGLYIMHHHHTFCFSLTRHLDTPLPQIELLKTKLRAFMANPDNSREWGSPGCEVWIDKVSWAADWLSRLIKTGLEDEFPKWYHPCHCYRAWVTIKPTPNYSSWLQPFRSGKLSELGWQMGP